jgi:hypothetical protein
MTTPSDIENLTLSLSTLKITTMPREAIKAKTITGLDTLDFDKKNYVRWSEAALDAFLYGGICEYVLTEVPKPADGHSDLPTWTKNDNLAQAGICMHVSDAEKDYLRSCNIKSASDIWKALKTRHRQKASTQTSLLDDLLSIRIDRDSEMVKKVAHIREICKHIFEIGTLDEDKLASVVLLHALSSDLRHIRDKQEDNDTSTPADIVQSLEKAKMRWEEETKTERDTEERANAARIAAKSQTTSKNTKNGACTTCNGKHRTDECWGEGGAMEGRHDEVLEQRAARRKEKDSKQADKPSSTPNTKPTGKPRIAMKDASGKTVYFTMVDDEADTAASTISDATGIIPNSELEELYEAYHTCHDRRDSNASEYFMLAEVKHMALTASNGEYPPFAADTGTTVHLSPVKDDFYTFQTINPQKIFGVGGTYIKATAKGDIHICDNSNRTFILCHDLACLQHFRSALTLGIPGYRSNEIGKYLNIFATKDKTTHTE